MAKAKTRRGFCVHCPGVLVHKMSCSAFKGGYVNLSEPCTERALYKLSPIREGRLTLPVGIPVPADATWQLGDTMCSIPVPMDFGDYGELCADSMGSIPVPADTQE